MNSSSLLTTSSSSLTSPTDFSPSLTPSASNVERDEVTLQRVSAGTDGQVVHLRLVDRGTGLTARGGDEALLDELVLLRRTGALAGGELLGLLGLLLLRLLLEGRALLARLATSLGELLLGGDGAVALAASGCHVCALLLRRGCWRGR
jgi:hypothetical protein